MGCTVTCTGTNSCYGVSIMGPTGGALSVYCVGPSACNGVSAVTSGTGGDTGVHCEDGTSCQVFSVYGNSGVTQLICSAVGACKNSYLTCSGSGTCEIVCYEAPGTPGPVCMGAAPCGNISCP
jgi:hypothetical protein